MIREFKLISVALVVLLSSCSTKIDPNPQTVIICRVPGSDRTAPMKNWKFMVVRTQILKLVPEEGAGTSIGELEAGVAEALTAEELKQIGSLQWAVETVRLELEVRGELKRIKDSEKVRYTRIAKHDNG